MCLIDDFGSRLYRTDLLGVSNGTTLDQQVRFENPRAQDLTPVGSTTTFSQSMSSEHASLLQPVSTIETSAGELSNAQPSCCFQKRSQKKKKTTEKASRSRSEGIPPHGKWVSFYHPDSCLHPGKSSLWTIQSLGCHSSLGHIRTAPLTTWLLNRRRFLHSIVCPCRPMEAFRNRVAPDTCTHIFFFSLPFVLGLPPALEFSNFFFSGRRMRRSALQEQPHSEKNAPTAHVIGKPNFLVKLSLAT